MPYYAPYQETLLAADPEAILAAMRLDKKNTGDTLGCILTRGAGAMEQTKLSFDGQVRPLLADVAGAARGEPMTRHPIVTEDLEAVLSADLALGRSGGPDRADHGRGGLSAGLHGRDAAVSEREAARPADARPGPGAPRGPGAGAVRRLRGPGRSAAAGPGRFGAGRTRARKWTSSSTPPARPAPSITRPTPWARCRPTCSGTQHLLDLGREHEVRGFPVLLQRRGLRPDHRRAGADARDRLRFRGPDGRPLLLRRKQAHGRDRVRLLARAVRRPGQASPGHSTPTGRACL